MNIIEDYAANACHQQFIPKSNFPLLLCSGRGLGFEIPFNRAIEGNANTESIMEMMYSLTLLWDFLRRYEIEVIDSLCATLYVFLVHSEFDQIFFQRVQNSCESYIDTSSQLDKDMCATLDRRFSLNTKFQNSVSGIATISLDTILQFNLTELPMIIAFVADFTELSISYTKRNTGGNEGAPPNRILRPNLTY